jgi:hypothetical protein
MQLRTKLTLAGTSIFIFGVNILRRKNGWEEQLRLGEISEAYVFWVSGVVDGLIWVITFLLLVSLFMRLRQKKRKIEPDVFD